MFSMTQFFPLKPMQPNYILRRLVIFVSTQHMHIHKDIARKSDN